METCLAIRVRNPEMMCLAAESLVRIIQYISQTGPFLREFLCYCFRLDWSLPTTKRTPGRQNVVLKCSGNLAEGFVSPPPHFLSHFIGTDRLSIPGGWRRLVKM